MCAHQNTRKSKRGIRFDEITPVEQTNTLTDEAYCIRVFDGASWLYTRQTYDCNGRPRITTYPGPGNPTQNYSYDAFGNMSGRSGMYYGYNNPRSQVIQEPSPTTGEMAGATMLRAKLQGRRRRVRTGPEICYMTRQVA